VIHEEQPNPAYGGPDSGEPATISGAVIAIQVAVPREQEEMLHYIVTTGEYRVALLSPNAAENDPTLGMTWDDLKAFFWAEREQALGSLVITDTTGLVGPGAAAIVATAQATPYPTPILTSPALTPTAAVAEEGAAETPAAGPAPTSVPLPVTSPTPEEAAQSAPTAAAIPGTTGSGGLFGSSALSGIVCAGAGLLLLAVIVLAAVTVIRRRRAARSGQPASAAH
jgi:hypothetical protein